MSATEKIAEKYIDEVVGFAPLEVFFAFVTGVCLLNTPPTGSAWIAWLTQSVAHSSDLVEGIRRQQVWVLILLGCSGPISAAIVRYSVRMLLATAADTIAEQTKSIYSKLSNQVNERAFVETALPAALEWRKLRGKRVTRATRLGTCFLALSFITIGQSLRTTSGIDLLLSLVLLAVAGWLVWTAFESYLTAYLPERLLLDAALGLSEVKLTGFEEGL